MKTILQVEDDPDDVFLFQYAMTKAGVKNPIQVATDGREAIDYLQAAGKFSNREKYPFPCLVLLDMDLPYVMGLDVLKWIRQTFGNTLTVLMLTSSSEETDIATAYRFGANGFLTKPSEATDLYDMIKATANFWLTHNTLPQEMAAESPMEGVVSLVRSTTMDFVPQPLTLQWRVASGEGR